MKIFRNLFLFALTLFCVAAQAAPTIIFERGDSIWSAHLDGSHLKKLMVGGSPQISPDGTRVVFNTDESKTAPIRYIAVLELASGKVAKFTNIPSNNSFNPAWSPDSKKIIFSTYLDDDWQLALINADGSDYHIVKHADKKSNSYFASTWAADGKSFFCHDLDSIFQLDLKGNLIKKWSLRSIIPGGGLNSSSRLAASPNGKWLMLEVDMNEESPRQNWDEPPPSVWLLELATDKVTRLTKNDFYAWDPYWVTDEDFILISQGPNEKDPSIYRGSIKNRSFSLILKDAWTPSVSVSR